MDRARHVWLKNRKWKYYRQRDRGRKQRATRTCRRPWKEPTNSVANRTAIYERVGTRRASWKQRTDWNARCLDSISRRPSSVRSELEGMVCCWNCSSGRIIHSWLPGLLLESIKARRESMRSWTLSANDRVSWTTNSSSSTLTPVRRRMFLAFDSAANARSGSCLGRG